MKTISDPFSQHIIICGYGRVGQNIARFLNKIKRPYIGLDLDPGIIRNAQLAGDWATYGNATQLDILKAAKLNEAAAIVISFNDASAAISIIEQIRQVNPKIPILVRCKDEVEFENLTRSGATKIVAEIFEESLSLVNQLLQVLHVPKTQTVNLLQETRDKNYALLYQVFPGSFTEEFVAAGTLHEHLRPIPLPEGATAVGLTLGKLALTNVEVIAIRRGKKHVKPKQDTKLAANDILILYGLPTHLDDAEEVLLA